MPAARRPCRPVPVAARRCQQQSGGARSAPLECPPRPSPAPRRPMVVASKCTRPATPRPRHGVATPAPVALPPPFRRRISVPRAPQRRPSRSASQRSRAPDHHGACQQWRPRVPPPLTGASEAASHLPPLRPPRGYATRVRTILRQASLQLHWPQDAAAGTARACPPSRGLSPVAAGASATWPRASRAAPPTPWPSRSNTRVPWAALATRS
mmetsp:Transcript_80908/g.262019  ORF Transcript_80908/g.262019 Transcript_80908/m.262019 type:complete len:211 (-) Transcript_80908:370-1002(-)